MPIEVTRSKRTARQKGNTALEAAFILIPLFGLIFAIVDFGLAIFVRSTMQHATREGVRYAITYQLKDGLAHDASIKSVVTTNAMGFLNSEANQEKIKIRYFDPATLGEVSVNSPGNLIEVSVENYTWGWITNIMRDATPLQITTRSSDRMEGLPGGTSPPTR